MSAATQSATALDLLTDLWGVGPHSLCWKHASDGFRFAFYDSPGALLDAAGVLGEADTWFGVAALTGTPSKGRGGRDDVANLSALFADLDWVDGNAHKGAEVLDEDTVRRRLASMPLAPSYIVNSGHGAHCYWLLDSPVDPTTTEDLQQRLHARLRTVGLQPERIDLPSILRLPGTTNWKTSDARPVVIEQASRRRYSVETIIEAHPLEVAPTPSTSTSTSTEPEWAANLPTCPAAASGLDGPGPMDRVASLLDVRQELARRGWTHVGGDSHGEHWRHPDATSELSASINGNGRAYVFTPSTPLPQSTDHNPATLDALDVIAYYDHRGSRTEAARALAPSLGVEWSRSTPLLQAVTTATAIPGQPATMSSYDEDAVEEVRAAESYHPVDLAEVLNGTYEQPVPTMLERRGDGIGDALIYPNAVNGFHGDSGTGKSWIAIHLLAEQITAGRNVMLLDLEDGPGSIVARLQLLGVTAEAIGEHLTYIKPVDMFGPLEVDLVVDQIIGSNIVAVVIDSVGEAFALNGVNEDRDNEVGPWFRSVARILAEHTAVVLIDHATKAKDAPLYPSGSKRKRAAITGASYVVEVTDPLVKGKGGRLKITCAKDRHGTFGQGQHVANFVMHTHADGEVVTEVLAAAPATEGDGADNADERVAKAVTETLAGTPSMSKKALKQAVNDAGTKVGSDRFQGVIELMEHRGDVVIGKGERGALMVSLPAESDLS